MVGLHCELDYIYKNFEDVPQGMSERLNCGRKTKPESGQRHPIVWG